MKERIAYIMQEKSLSASSFADILGVQASGISHILSGRNNPSLDFIIRFLTKFPEVNSEWFILGKGNIYRAGDLQDGITVDIDTRNDIYSNKQSTQEDYLSPLTPHAQSTPKHEANLFNSTNKDDGSLSAAINEEQPQISIQTERNTNSGNCNAIERNSDKTIIGSINDKKIKRVMIFYSDNTVESYDYIL